MRFLFWSRFPRLREVVGILLLIASLGFFVSLASYDPADPSWNTATLRHPPHNLTGRFGSHLADFCFQLMGLAAWMAPGILTLLGWHWTRNRPVEAPLTRVAGYTLIILAIAGVLGLSQPLTPYGGAFPVGGVLGFLISDICTRFLNPLGTGLLLAAMFVVSIYLVSSFSVNTGGWSLPALPSLPKLRWRKKETAAPPPQEPAPAPVNDITSRLSYVAPEPMPAPRRRKPTPPPAPPVDTAMTPMDIPGNADAIPSPRTGSADLPPWDESPAAVPAPVDEDIPIRPLEDQLPAASVLPSSGMPEPRKQRRPEPHRTNYVLPPTVLLNEPAAREAYDSQELKDTAGRIKAKLEEFNVLGSVVQINPGPVVTTFEFKPDAGVKIARITTLSEDLCLGLQAESILIERIPGKPTVGIEVPNSRREQISLRQILESDEFLDAGSRLTIALGKDISGRIRIAELEKMPHLLIAGSTGSGKSVMLNALIMSALYKSTPDEVRLILVDPKRLELGLYEGIPHLLTPVITEPKKAVNALRNAVLEMERRLKLLASHGVRNIDQFNRKLRQKQEKPLNLFLEQEEAAVEEEKPLPYILIVIDELADLMMQERSGVEESVVRLAQMARAVGMHLVVATQRPSVDVITGLIKANFPARISFRVATRVDSRTVLDVMGAEHLLGKGDMLFLPPGTSRLLRVHGAFVTEQEINDVVEFWKQQAKPEYDQTFLIAPPSDDDDEAEEFDGEEDPLYQDAVRVVLEMGKASTSILQRRLRLGYGRAARILDMMQHEGIIGPPDGSRPREVLKRPDWLDEVETSVRA